MIGRVNSGGGGANIQGIVEQYKVKAGENINAGDFVGFVNESGTNTVISNASYAGATISAVMLSENKVFIAHSYTGYTLYATVCTISGTTVNVGAVTCLSSLGNSGGGISAVMLSENKVFIAHSYTGYALYGMVCTISGTTITVGTDTPLESSNDSGRHISAVLLSSNKVFVAYGRTNSYYLWGMICTISGTTITSSGNKQISGQYYSGAYGVSAVRLSDNKVFIAHCYDNSNYRLYGIVCTISGSTITLGSYTQLSSTNTTAHTISAVALDENKVFVAHYYDGGNRYLYAVVCTISGTTITVGADTQLSSEKYSGWAISAIPISENEVFIAHSDGTDYSLYAMRCTINGTTITKGNASSLSIEDYSGYRISAVSIGNNGFFIAHCHQSNYYLRGISRFIAARSYGGVSGILGIGLAKTTGAGNDVIDVYVPDV